ncbi:hypothetical protein [Fibrella arboris]|uniref:hypothetical protein n=1 Tax=Fibrella arboris TaxID=3242486 RepID=UPI003520AB3C
MKKILKYLTEPLLHIFVTISSVFLIIFYEHAIKAAEEEKTKEINILFGIFIVFVILFIAASASSIFRSFQEKLEEEGKIKQTELEIEKIKAESNNKIAESNNKIEELKSELVLNNPIHVKFIPNHYDPTGKFIDEAYRISLEEVSKAKKSIWIVADYSPPKEPLIATTKRQSYYDQILKLLSNKLNDNTVGEPITYVRFMQRPDDIYKTIKANNGIIDDGRMIEGDEQAFAHCKKILDLREQNRSKVIIELYVTPIIPSLPSILIVDNNELLFTIPQRKVNTRQETKKHLDPVETAGVLHFTDISHNGKAIVEPFKKIIQTLSSNAETDKGETQIISSISSFDDSNEFKKWYGNIDY